MDGRATESSRKPTRIIPDLISNLAHTKINPFLLPKTFSRDLSNTPHIPQIYELTLLRKEGDCVEVKTREQEAHSSKY